MVGGSGLEVCVYLIEQWRASEVGHLQVIEVMQEIVVDKLREMEVQCSLKGH